MASAAAAAAAVSFLLLLFSASAASAACTSTTFSSNRVFAACNDLPHLSSSLHWTYTPATSTLSLAFVAPNTAPAGWISWAINPAGAKMIGSQALIAFRQPDGKMTIQTFNVSSYSLKSSPIDYRTSDLAADFVGGMMRIYAKVYLPPGMATVTQVWQVGASVTGGIPDKHPFLLDNLASMGSLDLVSGQTAVAAVSGLRERNIHGVLNAVSWGILLPMGAIMARYLRVFKAADPAWFYLHVSCQIIGYGVGVGGWATGLNLGKKSVGVVYTTHRNIGITLFVLGTLQLFALFLRPNKDHKYRFYWNIYHHLMGYIVIALGIVNVFRGLTILSPEQKWKHAYITIISILGGIAVVLEYITWIIVLKRRSSKLRSGLILRMATTQPPPHPPSGNISTAISGGPLGPSTRSTGTIIRANSSHSSASIPPPAPSSSSLLAGVARD